jgi:hypothetical protein
MGQRQRVRAAMAFLHDPQLVLLDEPGMSLDEPGVLSATRPRRRCKAQSAGSPCGSQSGTARLMGECLVDDVTQRRRSPPRRSPFPAE